jgi:hypothetical protein
MARDSATQVGVAEISRAQVRALQFYYLAWDLDPPAQNSGGGLYVRGTNLKERRLRWRIMCLARLDCGLRHRMMVRPVRFCPYVGGKKLMDHVTHL